MPWRSLATGNPIGARLRRPVSAAPGGERDQCLTGVVFSLTIVSLQLASSQFGPRLLRTFMTSRANQLVLGYRHLHLLPDRRWYRAGKSGVCATALDRRRHSARCRRHRRVDFFDPSRGNLDPRGIGNCQHHRRPSRRDREAVPSELGERPADPYEVERAWKEPSVASRSICSRPSGYIRHIDDEMLMSAARADVAAGTETNRVRGLTPSPAQRPVSSCGAVTGFDSGEPR